MNMEVATEIGKFLECGDLSPRPVDDFQLRRLRQVAANQSADRAAHSKSNSSLTLITTTLNIFLQRQFYKRSFVRALPEKTR